MLIEDGSPRAQVIPPTGIGAKIRPYLADVAAQMGIEISGDEVAHELRDEIACRAVALAALGREGFDGRMLIRDTRHTMDPVFQERLNAHYQRVAQENGLAVDTSPFRVGVRYAQPDTDPVDVGIDSMNDLSAGR